jgi:hypothetical protein
MNRLAIRDAEQAKHQAQKAMAALTDIDRPVGFQDPFRLHMARPSVMSFGMPLTQVEEAPRPSDDPMDAWFDSMESGDSDKVSKALKRIAETAMHGKTKRSKPIDPFGTYVSAEDRDRMRKKGVSNPFDTYISAEDRDEMVARSRKERQEQNAPIAKAARSKAKARGVSGPFTTYISAEDRDEMVARSKTARSKAKAAPSEGKYNRYIHRGVDETGSGKPDRKELIHVPQHVLHYFDVGNDPNFINTMKPPAAVPKT